MKGFKMLKTIAEAEYHRQSGATAVSSGLLRQCRIDGAETIFAKQSIRDTTGFLNFGSAVHAWILEPESFFQQYAIGGPEIKKGRAKGKPAKMYQATELSAAFESAFGMNWITPEEFKKVKAMAASLRSHPIFCDLLSTGVAERVAEAPLHGVNCHARIDWFNRWRHEIVDVKTTAFLPRWSQSVAKYGYAHQAAFYQDCFCGALGTDRRPRFYFAVADKSKDHRSRIYELPSALISHARKENQECLKKIRIHLESVATPAAERMLSRTD